MAGLVVVAEENGVGLTFEAEPDGDVKVDTYDIDPHMGFTLRIPRGLWEQIVVAMEDPR